MNEQDEAKIRGWCGFEYKTADELPKWVKNPHWVRPDMMPDGEYSIINELPPP